MHQDFVLKTWNPTQQRYRQIPIRDEFAKGTAIRKNLGLVLIGIYSTSGDFPPARSFSISSMNVSIHLVENCPAMKSG